MFHIYKLIINFNCDEDMAEILLAEILSVYDGPNGATRATAKYMMAVSGKR